MIVVVVTFKLSSEIDSISLKEKFIETSTIYQDTVGLIRKNYISDTENNSAGGVYCFDTMENAKSWFDEERVQWITDRYSKPSLNFYESPVIVDNEKGKILS